MHAVAWDVINDIKENIKNKASKTKIAGDIIRTAVEGSIGTGIGASTDFVTSVRASAVLDGMKLKKEIGITITKRTV
ncbi:hypothetical protein D0U04_24960 [Bacillus clarus]|uniref:Uncharacterized protein n=1 Tax=Bacillus clarus TaxID=2338372 RepID=A0A090Z397_9BACI|nr:hypothetical protein [Bacillus clarus]KFM98890.1 hypothetical protein DJ93_305 [Bacillus clarus]RFT63446.1 hypothetical protein D0U04_24960 [Bacillus clarus]